MADLPAARDRARRCALGKEPFDTLLTGGQVASLATGELLKADVGMAGPLVAAVLPRGSSKAAHQLIDIKDQVVIPGLIDCHMHVESSLMDPAAYAEAVVPRGVLAVAWDPHDLANVLGLDGVRWSIEATRGLPLRFLIQAPSCVPSCPGLERSGAEFGAEEAAIMLGWEGIGGLAEVMDMQAVTSGEGRMAAILAAAHAAGKPAFGHARDLEGEGLQAYLAMGIATDHEVSSADDLQEKLRAGMGIELRGSHPHLLPEFVGVLNSLPNVPATVALCTDDFFPDELMRHGGVDEVLRQVIGHGLDPFEALRLATCNPAARFGWKDGGHVAAGKLADLVVVGDLRELEALLVFSAGELVAKDGSMLSTPARPAAAPLLDSVRGGKLTVADFGVHASGEGQVELPTIDRPRFTSWGQIAVEVKEGLAHLPADALTMAVCHRHNHAEPRVHTAPLTGWGTWSGALATTFSHDAHNLTVFGSNPIDMLAAANAVVESRGGIAVAKEGEILAALPLPWAGLLSGEGAAATAATFEKVRAAADMVGDWQPPERALKHCFGASLVCNPGPRLSDVGVVDPSAD